MPSKPFLAWARGSHPNCERCPSAVIECETQCTWHKSEAGPMPHQTAAGSAQGHGMEGHLNCGPTSAMAGNGQTCARKRHIQTRVRSNHGRTCVQAQPQINPLALEQATVSWVCPKTSCHPSSLHAAALPGAKHTGSLAPVGCHSLRTGAMPASSAMSALLPPHAPATLPAVREQFLLGVLQV